MVKKEQLKINKQPRNKKAQSKLIIRIITLIVLVGAMIVGAYFSADGFRFAYKTGIAYSGGYQVQVGVYDRSDPSFSDDTANGDNVKGLDLLRDKLDPLANQNLYLQTLGKHSLEVIVGKQMFETYNNLNTTIQRLGAIYLTDSKGKDLLITTKDGGKERIPLSEVISGSSTSVDEARRPIIILAIKDQIKWDTVINSLKPAEGQGEAQPLYIWTDIGQFVDDLRHDVDNIQTISTAFNAKIKSQVSSTDWTNIFQIFNVEYYDSATSQIIQGNLLDLAISRPTEEIKTIMNDSRFKYTSVPTGELLIDPNDKTKVENTFIDPLRPFLQTIIQYNKPLTDLYKKYIINWNSIRTAAVASTNANRISTATATEAKQITNLINGGLSGLEFKTHGFREISAVVSQSVFNASMIVLGIIVLLIFGYLIAYYRLFGIIAILTLLFTIIITLYFSSLLEVQISPESIAALIIAFGLGLEGNLLFFSRYKRERYANQLPYEPAMKIANKQTVAIFIDALVVLIILGLALFWQGTNNIKSFATILLVGLIASIIMVFAVARFMYWIVIKLRWQEKVKWLDISNFSIWNILNKKKPDLALAITNNALLGSQGPAFDIKTTPSIVQSDEASIESNSTTKTLQPKKDWRGKWSFYNITKWTPVAGIILLIIALAVGFAGKANVDSSIKPGTNITINGSLWGQSSSTDQEAINNLATRLNVIRSEGKYNFSYNIYVLKANENASVGSVLVVSTNITKGTFERELLASIASYYGATADDIDVSIQQTKPIMEEYVLTIAGISIGIGLACIFVYTLFRLDWAQFVGMVLASIFALVVIVSIAFVSHILITFEMSIAFLAIFGFTIAIATIVMARAKQNKRTVNIREYETFFTYMSEHRAQVRRLRKAHKIYLKEELQKLAQKHPDLKIKELKKEYRAQLKTIKIVGKDIKSANRKSIKEINKDFRGYNYSHNFLQKIANITTKQMIQHCLTLGIMLGVLLITLAAFSGSWFGFNIIIFVGLVVGMFSTLFVGIPIWVVLEKYRALNKIRVKNYLDSQRVEIDEQIVLGIND